VLARGILADGNLLCIEALEAELNEPETDAL
jgi:hypothetical protein